MLVWRSMWRWEPRAPWATNDVERNTCSSERWPPRPATWPNCASCSPSTPPASNGRSSPSAAIASSPSREGHVDPPLSPRAELTLHGRSLSGGDRRSTFDVLLGCLSDPRSGAATVLRHLGVRLGEIRRLVELGAARLDRREVENLIAALDRRDHTHYSWWGPEADAGVARIGLPNQRPQLIARSETAELTLDAVVAGPDGFGLTITVASLGDWVLPPVWESIEYLSPGVGAEHRLVPEVVTIDLRYSDGTHVSNRQGNHRWRSDMPDARGARPARHEAGGRGSQRPPSTRCATWRRPSGGPGRCRSTATSASTCAGRPRRPRVVSTSTASAIAARAATLRSA